MAEVSEPAALWWIEFENGNHSTAYASEAEACADGHWKPAPKPDNPEHCTRFRAAARDAGAEDRGEAFGRVFDEVARSKPDEKPKRGKME
jgi:hypothetical protein